MGKQFDELAKALASGVSRRSALKRFASGAVGAAFASVFTGRSADAQKIGPEAPSDCQKFCREFVKSSSGRAFGRCVSFCASCLGRGGIPDFLTLNYTGSGEFICLEVNTTNGG
jgi:hypothetical protein